MPMLYFEVSFCLIYFPFCAGVYEPVHPTKNVAMYGHLKVRNGDPLMVVCFTDHETEILWTKDGEPLEFASPTTYSTSQYIEDSTWVASILEVRNAHTEHSGAYSCTNVSTVSHQVIVTEPYDSPLGSKVMDCVHMVINTSVKLTCTVPHNYTGEVSWLKDGKPLTSSDRAVVTSSHLVIHGAMDADAGKYSCMWNTTSDDKSIHTAQHYMLLTPILMHPFVKFHQTHVGGRISILCSAKSFPKPKVAWYFGKLKVKRDVSTGRTEENQSLLSLNNIQVSNMGTYTCVASHQHCSNVAAKMSFHLYAPKGEIVTNEEYPGVGITLDPSAESLRLSCQYPAVPHVTIKWWKDNKKIEEYNGKGKYTVDAENQSLVIDSPTEDDIGNYTCLALGVNKTAVILVGLRATIMKEATPVSGHMAGKKVYMSCMVDGIPTPYIRWFRDNKLIKTSSLERLKYKEAGGVFPGTLEIHDLAREDSGTYSCVADNGHSQELKQFQVEVKTKADAILPVLLVFVEVVALCILVFNMHVQYMSMLKPPPEGPPCETDCRDLETALEVPLATSPEAIEESLVESPVLPEKDDVVSTDIKELQPIARTDEDVARDKKLPERPTQEVGGEDRGKQDEIFPNTGVPDKEEVIAVTEATVMMKMQDEEQDPVDELTVEFSIEEMSTGLPTEESILPARFLDYNLDGVERLSEEGSKGRTAQITTIELSNVSEYTQQTTVSGTLQNMDNEEFEIGVAQRAGIEVVDQLQMFRTKSKSQEKCKPTVAGTSKSQEKTRSLLAPAEGVSELTEGQLQNILLHNGNAEDLAEMTPRVEIDVYERTVKGGIGETKAAVSDRTGTDTHETERKQETGITREQASSKRIKKCLEATKDPILELPAVLRVMRNSTLSTGEQQQHDTTIDLATVSSLEIIMKERAETDDLQPKLSMKREKQMAPEKEKMGKVKETTDVSDKQETGSVTAEMKTVDQSEVEQIVCEAAKMKVGIETPVRTEERPAGTTAKEMHGAEKGADTHNIILGVYAKKKQKTVTEKPGEEEEKLGKNLSSKENGSPRKHDKRKYSYKVLEEPYVPSKHVAHSELPHEMEDRTRLARVTLDVIPPSETEEATVLEPKVSLPKDRAGTVLKGARTVDRVAKEEHATQSGRFGFKALNSEEAIVSSKVQKVMRDSESQILPRPSDKYTSGYAPLSKLQKDTRGQKVKEHSIRFRDTHIPELKDTSTMTLAAMKDDKRDRTKAKELLHDKASEKITAHASKETVISTVSHLKPQYNLQSSRALASGTVTPKMGTQQELRLSPEPAHRIHSLPAAKIGKAKDMAQKEIKKSPSPDKKKGKKDEEQPAVTQDKLKKDTKKPLDQEKQDQGNLKKGSLSQVLQPFGGLFHKAPKEKPPKKNLQVKEEEEKPKDSRELEPPMPAASPKAEEPKAPVNKDVEDKEGNLNSLPALSPNMQGALVEFKSSSSDVSKKEAMNVKFFESGISHHPFVAPSTTSTSVSSAKRAHPKRSRHRAKRRSSTSSKSEIEETLLSSSAKSQAENLKPEVRPQAVIPMVKIEKTTSEPSKDSLVRTDAEASTTATISTLEQAAEGLNYLVTLSTDSETHILADDKSDEKKTQTSASETFQTQGAVTEYIERPVSLSSSPTEVSSKTHYITISEGYRATDTERSTTDLISSTSVTSIIDSMKYLVSLSHDTTDTDHEVSDNTVTGNWMEEKVVPRKEGAVQDKKCDSLVPYVEHAVSLSDDQSGDMLVSVTRDIVQKERTESNTTASVIDIDSMDQVVSLSGDDSSIVALPSPQLLTDDKGTNDKAVVPNESLSVLVKSLEDIVLLGENRRSSNATSESVPKK